MKQTLLEIVQDIGYLIETDEIGSIKDTYESEQIARIVKKTYESLMVANKWPHLDRLIKIQGSGTSSLPTHMKMQDKVSHVWEVDYNVESYPGNPTRETFVNIKYKAPEVFLRAVTQEDNTSTEVDTVVDPSGVNLYIRNDRQPTFYTSFDDEWIVFDSYDKTKSSTLIPANVRVRAKVLPQFVLDDDYIPDLPEEAFPLLFEESLSRASFVIRQEVDQKAEQMAGKQNRWLSRNSGRADVWKVKYPNYGRRV